MLGGIRYAVVLTTKLDSKFQSGSDPADGELATNNIEHTSALVSQGQLGGVTPSRRVAGSSGPILHRRRPSIAVGTRKAIYRLRELPISTDSIS